LVDGFQEAKPESAIRAMLAPHVVMPEAAVEDPLVQAQALFAESRFADAEAVLKNMLTEDNTNAKALILYGRCLAERGELTEAQAVLDAVKSDEHKAELAGAKAQTDVLAPGSRPAGCTADLKTRVAQNPQDDEAAYQLAVQQLARQQYEGALEGC
jgi:putative thioredoxin